jgi:hypothetical protein
VDPRVRTIITGTDGFSDTIVTWGGTKPAGRRPRIRRTAALHGLTRNKRLQNRANARARRVTVSALLDRPHVTDDADDDVGSGGDPFFGNEEVQLPRASNAEAGEQSPLHDRVTHEVYVSIEVEPEWARADLPHCHNGGQISFFASTDQRHRRAVTHRRQIVMCGAGKDMVTLDERESLLVTAPPRGLHLRGVKRGVCGAAEAFG